MTDSRIARLGKNEVPGPGNMCFHWLKSMHVCILKPGHFGGHRHAKFTLNDMKIKEK